MKQQNIYLGKLLFLLTLLAFLSMQNSAESQLFSSIEIGGGLTTAWINGANPAIDKIQPRGDQYYVGGGFDGQQAGFGIRGRFGIGEKWRIPIGLDYIFYRGAQRYSFPNADLLFNHSIDMPTILLGVEYVPIKFNRVAKLYVGAEGRVAFLQKGTFQVIQVPDYSLTREGSYTIDDNKDATTRFGAALRLGVEGQVEDDFLVDISVAYGAINLAKRVYARGELLTPGFPQVELQESVVGNVLFSLMVMYKL